MAIEVGREYKLEMGTAYGSSKAITGITKGASTVFSSATHDFVVGDYVLLRLQGMVELDQVVAKVSAISAGISFTVAIDSTNFGDWQSGSDAIKVTTWQTISAATSVDFGAGSIEEVDVTTLVDKVTRRTNGPLTLPPVSVNLFTDPDATVQDAVDAYAYAGTVVAFRATRKSGKCRTFAGVPSTIGEAVSVNSPISGSFSVIVRSARHLKHAAV